MTTLVNMKPVVVIREPWRADPLAWIHRGEARAIARELGAPLAEYRRGALPERALLRLSDPAMLRAVGEIDIPHFGPGREALERCYDKHEANRIVAAAGIEVPKTDFALAARLAPAPFVLKPRRGSDSMGVRVASRVPHSMRDRDHLVQQRIIGREVTIAVFRDRVGAPLEILLPPGKPYSFVRKYALRPRRRPLVDEALAAVAQRVARLLGVDWAARVDVIVEQGTGRAYFLECDAAPLVGPRSAFAESFSVAGIGRPRQLEWLVEG
jgi:D-alanine-D-alanine ligase-like ATP-grasp enzyme